MLQVSGEAGDRERESSATLRLLVAAGQHQDIWLMSRSVAAGIWGGKGQGKTFQCNLAYKKLDISPIVMSAGELESGNAGEPAKLIRQRYREVCGCSVVPQKP